MESDNTDNEDPDYRLGKERELNEKERLKVFCFVQARVEDGKVPHGVFTEVAERFGLARTTVSRIYRRLKDSDGDDAAGGQNLRGRKQKWDPEEFCNRIPTIPLRKRTTYRRLTMAYRDKYGSGPSVTLVKHWFNTMMIFRKHSSAFKTKLTPAARERRLKFCMSRIDPLNLCFRNQYDEVHVDEKWFFVSKEGQTYYLANHEDDPVRRVQHKSHVGKVMFLCAVARPRYCHTRKYVWDGKIGCWPVGYIQPAKYNSKNRPAGTLEWQDLNVNRERYRNILMDKLLPAIKEKWPPGGPKVIKIQQDGARAHIKEDDIEFYERAMEMDVEVELYTQPANSPDLNVLDLGFFRALQSFNENTPRTSMQLIDAVKEAFEKFPKEQLNKCFITLQSCMDEIIKIKGDNNYKIPHMNKDKLEREGRLPVCLETSDALNEMLLEGLEEM